MSASRTVMARAARKIVEDMAAGRRVAAAAAAGRTVGRIAGIVDRIEAGQSAADIPRERDRSAGTGETRVCSPGCRC